MLPVFHSDDKNFSMMQTQWSQQLNKILDIPMLNGISLNQVSIVTGTNVINHRLSRKQQGWFITDIDSAVSIYRSEPFNTQTLTLTSSGNAVINLWVF
jgi:hypothetical protein